MFAVTVSLIGIMLLTLEDDFSINIANLKGDMLCIMCAVAYAIDLIITDRAVAKPEVNAYQLGKEIRLQSFAYTVETDFVRRTAERCPSRAGFYRYDFFFL